MTVEFSTHLGQIDVAAEVIETLAGKAALECYGLVGMASNKQFQDGLFELLGRDNFRKGVIVREMKTAFISTCILSSYMASKSQKWRAMCRTRSSIRLKRR